MLKKPYLLLISGTLILLLSCKKEVVTTGTVSVKFLSGVPSCYSIYTESAYADYHSPLFYNSGPPSGITVIEDLGTKTVTFKDLNAGNYVVTNCGSFILSVQVTAGMERTFSFP